MARNISTLERVTGYFKNIAFAVSGQHETPTEVVVRRRREAFYEAGSGYPNVFAITYNGEKNLGELGPAKQYLPDYMSLGSYSWAAYLDSEIAQIIFDKYVRWLIGPGLTLNAEPESTVLTSEGIELETEDFNELAEARFKVWSNSKSSSRSNMETLNAIAKTGWLNCKIGGDVLVILRVESMAVNVQLVDGAHVQSPAYGSDYYAQILTNGNVIRNGVEINPKGEHMAYYVRKRDMNYERIEARSKSTGLVMAYLVYGKKYRLDNTRGLPLISAVLETLKKLDRYKEATVGTAEEQAKIAYQITHQQYSTGENPLSKGSAFARAMDADANQADDLPVTEQGEQLANRVHATTNKQAYNMPIGAELKTIQHSNGQLLFKEFFNTNIDIVCATVGIPPSVAMSMYTDSFSASRMAGKDWENTIDVGRDDFKEQFYQPIYNLWLHVQILLNKIDAPGYLSAFVARNTMALEAYRMCRFTGTKFPHIDPLKEVKAEREKLGPLGANIPLTTVEKAVENLGGRDSDSIIEQFGKERQHVTDQGLQVDTPTPGIAPPEPDTEEEEED